MLKELGQEIAKSFKGGIYAKADSGVLNEFVVANAVGAVAIATSLQPSTPITPKIGVCEGGKATNYIAQPDILRSDSFNNQIKFGRYALVLHVNGDEIYFPRWDNVVPGNWYQVETPPSGIYFLTPIDRTSQEIHTVIASSNYFSEPVEGKQFCYEKVGDPIYEKDK